MQKHPPIIMYCMNPLVTVSMETKLCMKNSTCDCTSRHGTRPVCKVSDLYYLRRRHSGRRADRLARKRGKRKLAKARRHGTTSPMPPRLSTGHASVVLCLSPDSGAVLEREAGENGNVARGGEDPTRMRAYQAPGNRADFGAFVHAGRPTPNAGYFGAQAGLFTPNTAFMYPQMGHVPSLPYLPMPPLMPGQSSCSMLPQGRPELDSPQIPGTSSSVAQTSGHEDAISPFLFQTKGREFRDSEDSESDSDEEIETALNKEKFLLSENAVKQLAEIMEKPLKKTKRHQLLERFPQPAECDQAYPPKLDESISLIIPDSSRKEVRLLSRLQQFTMDSLGAITFLQEQLASPDFKKVRAVVKT